MFTFCRSRSHDHHIFRTYTKTSSHGGTVHIITHSPVHILSRTRLDKHNTIKSKEAPCYNYTLDIISCIATVVWVCMYAHPLWLRGLCGLDSYLAQILNKISVSFRSCPLSLLSEKICGCTSSAFADMRASLATGAYNVHGMVCTWYAHVSLCVCGGGGGGVFRKATSISY